MHSVTARSQRIKGGDEMARQKKDGVALNCFIDKSIADSLEKFCEETRLSKTATVERALIEYFNTMEENRPKQ